MSAPSSDRSAAKQIVNGLREAGWMPYEVDDGGEMVPVQTTEQALDAIFAVDLAWLFVKQPDTDRTGWVWFVLGNDPEEVAADYTTNLSPAIDPITEKWWN